MPKRKWPFALAGALVLACSGSVMAGSAASAAAEPSGAMAYECADQFRACLHSDKFGRGYKIDLNQCGEHNLPGEWWDKASSIRVNPHNQILLFSYASGGGKDYYGPMRAWDGYTIRNTFDHFDDKADGYKLVC